MSEDRTPRQQSQSGRYDQPERDDRTGRSAASERVRDQARWVDLQVQEAMRRGDFDNLPGAGKPLDLPESHDPDWWVKRLLERERITGLAPAAIALRLEDAELDAVLDREATAQGRTADRRGLQPPHRRGPPSADRWTARGHGDPRRRAAGRRMAAAARGPSCSGSGGRRARSTGGGAEAPPPDRPVAPQSRRVGTGYAGGSCMGIRTPRSAATSIAVS